MRTLLRVVLCCLVVTSCGGSGSSSPASAEPQAETFPLEVLGPSGTEVTLTMKVADAALLSRAESAAVTLTLHNIVQSDSAQLVINGGSPVDLSSVDGPFLHPDGRVTTAIVPINRALLVAGENRFVFRYTRQVIDAGSAISGYRVLNVTLQVGDKTLSSDVTREDPQQWRPIRDDARSIARGQLFFTASTRDDGPACARCHADSGADLQYYSFSNRSIVARAMFHRFTREESEDIASYIRSVDVVRAGRPYQAPFQPGADNTGAAGPVSMRCSRTTQRLRRRAVKRLLLTIPGSLLALSIRFLFQALYARRRGSAGCPVNSIRAGSLATTRCWRTRKRLLRMIHRSRMHAPSCRRQCAWVQMFSLRPVITRRASMC
jgi:hypothetical protein